MEIRDTGNLTPEQIETYKAYGRVHTMSNTTPQELNDDWEAIAENNNRATVGRGDAIYHIGKLIAGEWSPENVTNIQAEIADTQSYDYDAKYHYGYLTAWNAVSGLLKGQSLKDIAKYHG